MRAMIWASPLQFAAALIALLLILASPLRAQQSDWGPDWEIPVWVKDAAKAHLTETRDWEGSYYEIRSQNGSKVLRIFWLIPAKDLKQVTDGSEIMVLGGDDSLGLLVDPVSRKIVGEISSAEVVAIIKDHVAKTRGWPESDIEVQLTPMAGELLHLWVISKSARARFNDHPPDVVLLGSDGESFGLFINPRTKSVAHEYLFQ